MPNFSDYMELAEESRWTVGRTTGGHYRFVPPDPNKPAVVMSGTPSDARALKNFEGDLKRSGLDTKVLKMSKKERRSRARKLSKGPKKPGIFGMLMDMPGMMREAQQFRNQAFGPAPGPPRQLPSWWGSRT